MKSTLSRDIQTRGLVLISLVILLLIGLPLVVWLDLKNLTEANLRRQAGDLNSVVSSVRNYYATNVVGRILSSPGSTQNAQRVAHNYESISGAIPIPATLSLELGQVISEQQQNISYRFVSDYPFANRTAHVLDDFEKSSLAALRLNPSQQLADVSWSTFADRVRLIVPVVMGAACVNCHNAHPESPKHDWKVGDVRGIQEVTITQATASNIFSFKYLLTYFALMAACGTTFIGWQRRQAATIKGMNGELETANEFLAFAVDEDLALSVAADLQEHLQRPEGCDDPHRAQEAHDLLLRHQGLHGDRRAPAAGADHAAAQRIFHRDVGNRAQARRHGRQVCRRRHADLLRRSREQGGSARMPRRACAWRSTCSTAWPS